MISLRVTKANCRDGQREIDRGAALEHIKSSSLNPAKTKNTLVIGFVIVLQNERVIENSITVPIVSEQKMMAMA